MIKYIRGVLWRVAKRLSYIEDARCLKVNKVTNIHSEYVILIVIPRQKWLGEGASVLRCTYGACFVWETISNNCQKIKNHKRKVEKRRSIVTVTLDGIHNYRYHWALNGMTF